MNCEAEFARRSIASLAEHPIWHADVVTELLRCWNRAVCQPPLPDEEVVRTVDSIAHCIAGRRARRSR